MPGTYSKWDVFNGMWKFDCIVQTLANWQLVTPMLVISFPIIILLHKNNQDISIFEMQERKRFYPDSGGLLLELFVDSGISSRYEIIETYQDPQSSFINELLVIYLESLDSYLVSKYEDLSLWAQELWVETYTNFGFGHKA